MGIGTCPAGWWNLHLRPPERRCRVMNSNPSTSVAPSPIAHEAIHSMNPNPSPTNVPANTTNRREFLTRSTTAVAASALAGVTLPHVFAAPNDTVQLALIGSGNRGSGAIVNAMEATGSTTKLVAMADLYEDRLYRAHSSLGAKFRERVDVPTEHQFIGFDAYRKAIDVLRPHSGDIAM